MRGHPAVPSLLDTIVRGATRYFVLIFFVQFLAQLFLFFAPVGDTHYARACTHHLCMIRREYSSCRGRKFSLSLAQGGLRATDTDVNLLSIE